MFDVVITTAFGLETVVSRELKGLGYETFTIENGKITLKASIEDICRLNLWLRTAERIFIKIASFPVLDFGELFDQTTAVKWSDLFPADARIDVRGKSHQSQLHSVPDCQAIVKKAIIEQMKKSYHLTWFPEDGPLFPIQIAILKDVATLLLDTSGAGLNRRGYRTLVGTAPLRETLAAGLVLLSFWNSERLLIDPFCGSGTIAIEAALIGLNRAPGINRPFVSEQWPLFPAQTWKRARDHAASLEKRDQTIKIIGNDSDQKVFSMARFHAKKAGVDSYIHFQHQPFSTLQTKKKYGCIICNPPYGERLGNQKELDQLYRDMERVFKPLDTWSFYILTADPNFQNEFWRKPHKRRKLYNGKIACTYFQFFGPPPPRHSSVEQPATD